MLLDGCRENDDVFYEIEVCQSVFENGCVWARRRWVGGQA